MKAARIHSFSTQNYPTFRYPWVVTMSYDYNNYNYGLDILLSNQESQKRLVAKWCAENGLDDYIIGEQGGSVGFPSHHDAMLFYLAHA